MGALNMKVSYKVLFLETCCWFQTFVTCILKNCYIFTDYLLFFLLSFFAR